MRESRVLDRYAGREVASRLARGAKVDGRGTAGEQSLGVVEGCEGVVRVVRNALMRLGEETVMGSDEIMLLAVIRFSIRLQRQRQRSI